jgi:hypothetical protein
MFTRMFGLSGKRRLVAVGLSALGLTAVVAVLTVMFLGFNAHTAFGSGSGGGGCFSTSGPVCTFKGHQAYADFSSVSADGCVFTDAYVQAFESLTSPSRVDSQTVYLSIYQWNNCTGAMVIGADNMDPNTWQPAFSGTIQFGTQSASVNGTATMYDYVGGQSFTTTINVSWNGYGPTSTFVDSSHYRSPGFIMSTHDTGVSQAAEASGNYTDQSGANLAATPTLSAGLSNDSGGTVQMFHIK